MAFKSMDQYVEQKYENFFTLTNDQDYADVIFMYRSTADVMIAKSHYIKSSEYSGYVQCLESPDCPACNYTGPNGGRIDSRDKLFIPMYVITYSNGRKAGEIHFWDRNEGFQHVLASAVFSNYPNPSEYIFRITRNGQYRDKNTTYDIRCMQENNFASYDQICRDNHIIFPDYFNTICKDVSKADMDRMLNSNNNTSSSTPNYTPDQYGAIPRAPQPSMPEPIESPVVNPSVVMGTDSVPTPVAPPPVAPPLVAPAPVAPTPVEPAPVAVPTTPTPAPVDNTQPAAGPAAEELNSEDVDF